MKKTENNIENYNLIEEDGFWGESESLSTDEKVFCPENADENTTMIMLKNNENLEIYLELAKRIKNIDVISRYFSDIAEFDRTPGLRNSINDIRKRDLLQLFSYVYFQ